MTASTLADQCGDLALSLLHMRVELIALRRDLARRQSSASAAKYRPDQPRVPAGNPEGGQWSDGSGGASGPRDFGEWLAGGWADLGTVDTDWADGETLGEWQTPDDEARIEQVGSRGRSGGSWPGATPGQQARLAASELQAQAAIRRVQEIDGLWRPPASMSEGIEGAILSQQAAARQAETRLLELQSRGIGQGPFAQESIPARGVGRLREGEQAEVDRIGRLFGCHTCGTTEPGTRNGSFIGDHQLPSSLNRDGKPQLLYPHCASCSLRQGGFVRPFIRSER